MKTEHVVNAGTIVLFRHQVEKMLAEFDKHGNCLIFDMDRIKTHKAGTMGSETVRQYSDIHYREEV